MEKYGLLHLQEHHQVPWRVPASAESLRLAEGLQVPHAVHGSRTVQGARGRLIDSMYVQTVPVWHIVFACRVWGVPVYRHRTAGRGDETGFPAYGGPPQGPGLWAFPQPLQ